MGKKKSLKFRVKHALAIGGVTLASAAALNCGSSEKADVTVNPVPDMDLPECNPGPCDAGIYRSDAGNDAGSDAGTSDASDAASSENDASADASSGSDASADASAVGD